MRVLGSEKNRYTKKVIRSNDPKLFYAYVQIRNTNEQYFFFL